MERDGDFSELLRRQRAAAGLSQLALAARSGLSAQAIGLLERGLRRTPHNSTVRRLADALRLQGADRQALFDAARGVRTLPDRPIPRELPRPPADFTGRTHELTRLLDSLASGGDPVVITAIDGMGGVGKSALAIHAAHRLVAGGLFPDGQLYVDLQGASAGLEPLEPLDALGRLLRSLGVPAAAIPDEVDAAAALIRTLTADRRLLLVLDNARDVEQVRPLLPGSPTCGVLVTSRQALATLEGSVTLHLDVLPHEQALALFGRIAGAARVASEGRAAGEVVRRCAGLPLAIRIAGARLAARPGWRVGDLAERLVDAGRRIDELSAGALAVRATFDVSLAALRASADSLDQLAAGAFGLLSLPDGPDLSAAAVARLLDAAEPLAEAVLERLVDTQLLESPRPGRYRFHDLVRLHAREDAVAAHDEEARTAALVRCLTFSVATSWRTLALIRPNDARLRAADRRWTGGGLEFDGVPAALDWLDAERANLLAAVDQVAGSSTLPPALAGQLVTALSGYFLTRGLWRDWVRASQAVLDLARRSGDLVGQAWAVNDLGLAHERLGRYDEAAAEVDQSVAIWRELGDRLGQAAAVSNLGLIHWSASRWSEAAECALEGLALTREIGDLRGQASSLSILGLAYRGSGRLGEAIACQRECASINRQLGDRQQAAWGLNNLGMAYVADGRPAEAIEPMQECLRIAEELGLPQMQAVCFDTLGLVYQGVGRSAEALECWARSIASWRDCEHRLGLAEALQHRGDACHALGQLAAARRDWREALQIYDELGAPEAEAVRARLGR